MKRAWRLKAEADVQRVWDQGGAWTHPLLVLRIRPNELGRTRAAFVVSKKIGHAVARNRAKRLMREAMRSLFPQLAPGYDVVVIARPAVGGASFIEVRAALEELLKKSRLLARDLP